MNWRALLRKAYLTGRIPNWRVIPGFLILAAIFLGGNWLQIHLHLLIPGNILGMFILLGLLLTGIMPVSWVEDAAAILLWLLPLLFLPVFAVSLEDKGFWLRYGAGFFVATLLGLVALWAVVGWLARMRLRRPHPAPGSTGEMPPQS